MCSSGLFPADVYTNLVKYGLAAFVGPTIFLLLLLCLGIKITTAKLNVFIFVSQCIATPSVITNVLTELESNIHIAPPYIVTVAQVIFACYGIWNLDFFRTLLPSICLNINTRQALALDFIVAFSANALQYVLTRSHLCLYGGCAGESKER